MDLEKELNGLVISDAQEKEDGVQEEAEEEASPAREPATIGDDSLEEQQLMIKRKETIMLLSLKRRAEQEAKRAKREAELARKREEASKKKEMQEHRKLEHKQRREAILEQYRLKKMADQAAADHQGNHSYPSSSSSGHASNHATTTSSTTNSENSHKSSTDHHHHHRHHHQNHNNHNHLSSNGSTTSQANHTSASNHSSSSGAPAASGLQRPTTGMSNMRGCKSTQSSTSTSSWNLYTGPKLFAKPTIKTNLILIQNALLKALEGAANAKLLKKMQDTITAHSKTCAHFLILFRSRNQFRGLYEYQDKQETITKLDGAGPRSISNDDIVKYYKFDSPKRLFTEVQTRQISLTIIAITIQDHFWSKT